MAGSLELLKVYHQTGLSDLCRFLLLLWHSGCPCSDFNPDFATYAIFLTASGIVACALWGNKPDLDSAVTSIEEYELRGCHFERFCRFGSSLINTTLPLDFS